MKWKLHCTDGSVHSGLDGAWADAPSAGIDFVDLVHDSTGYRMQGRSVYWLRAGGDGQLVLGGGTVTDVEEVYFRDGCSEVSSPEFMPDLEHSQVKLGWWLP